MRTALSVLIGLAGLVAAQDESGAATASSGYFQPSATPILVDSGSPSATPVVVDGDSPSATPILLDGGSGPFPVPTFVQGNPSVITTTSVQGCFPVGTAIATSGGTVITTSIGTAIATSGASPVTISLPAPLATSIPSLPIWDPSYHPGPGGPSASTYTVYSSDVAVTTITLPGGGGGDVATITREDGSAAVTTITRGSGGGGGLFTTITVTASVPVFTAHAEEALVARDVKEVNKVSGAAERGVEVRGMLVWLGVVGAVALAL